MSKLDGSPFGWGFVENRGIETLAQRASAGYNEPMEVNDRYDNLGSFFKEEFGTAPNPAHVVKVSPIEPEPYLPFGGGGDDGSDDSGYDGSDDSGYDGSDDSGYDGSDGSDDSE